MDLDTSSDRALNMASAQIKDDQKSQESNSDSDSYSDSVGRSYSDADDEATSYRLQKHCDEYCDDKCNLQSCQDWDAILKTEGPNLSDQEKLCRACASFFEEGGTTDGYRFRHYRYRSSLRRSTLYGCRICTFLTAYLDAPHDNSRHSPDEDMSLYFERRTRSDFDRRNSPNTEARYQVNHIVRVYYYYKQSSEDSKEYWYREDRGLLSFEKDVGKPSEIVHTPTSRTGSPENVKLFSKWLAHCKENHKVCGKRAKSSFLPTRLIQVNKPSQGKVRLVETSGIDFAVEYLTLSHRWGEKPMKQLFKADLDLWRDGLDIDTLPLTFRDALEVVQWCGAEYIWIDSLCIIQDSSDDWAHESVMMKNIYQNCLCNIAATSAIDSSQGCFWERDPKLVEPVSVHIGWENADPGLYKCYDLDFWLYAVDLAPLNRRGWVLQERLLSPRIVHFTRNEMFWECHELQCSESFPSGLPDSIFQINNLDWSIKKPTLSSVSSWQSILIQYSDAALSYRTDKLIAFAGIVQEMMDSTGEEYICGLWKSRLVEDLCWVRTSQQQRPTQECSADCQPPSWSWLSIEGGCNLGNKERDATHRNRVVKLFQIQNIIQLPLNDCSRITYASITGAGSLKSISPSPEDFFQTPDHNHVLEVANQEFKMWGVRSTSLAILFDYKDIKEREKDSEMFLLPVFIELDRYLVLDKHPLAKAKGGDVCNLIKGLVVALVKEGEEGNSTAAAGGGVGGEGSDGRGKEKDNKKTVRRVGMFYCNLVIETEKQNVLEDILEDEDEDYFFDPDGESEGIVLV